MGKKRIGSVVTIYEDPVERMRPEGRARLVRHLEDEYDGVVGLERWWVVLLDDDKRHSGETLDREIHGLMGAPVEHRSDHRPSL